MARFEGDPATVDAAIDEMTAFAASSDVPPDLASAKALLFVDRQSGGRLVMTMFDTEEAMCRGDAAMNAGQPRHAGRRSSVELHEVARELTLEHANNLTRRMRTLPSSAVRACVPPARAAPVEG